MNPQIPADWQPHYERWRHGGWYVLNVRYPSGACGCVSRNYPDHKWRIVCDDRRGDELGTDGDYTFPSRDAAARAEYILAQAKKERENTMNDMTIQLAILRGIQHAYTQGKSPMDAGVIDAFAQLDIDALVAQLEGGASIASTLYAALDDASSVVDAGDDEDYAYQAELEAGARFLGIERN